MTGFERSRPILLEKGIRRETIEPNRPGSGELRGGCCSSKHAAESCL